MMCLLFALKAQAASIQFVSIGVDGLTCSMCTRSVEMSIRKLDFVDSVVMDLENTNGKVYLQEGVSPDFRKLAKAVTDAGFSVRSMRISIDWNNLEPGDPCFSIGQNTFQLIGNRSNLSQRKVELELLGEHFMPKKNAREANRMVTGSCNPRPDYYVRIQ